MAIRTNRDESSQTNEKICFKLDIDRFEKIKVDLISIWFWSKSIFFKDDADWNHENVKLGLLPGQNYQELNFEIGNEDDQNNSAKASQDHNLSINEAAALRGMTSSNKKLKLDTGFSIAELSEFHEDSLSRIRQNLVKSYWGCASIAN